MLWGRRKGPDDLPTSVSPYLGAQWDGPLEPRAGQGQWRRRQQWGLCSGRCLLCGDQIGLCISRQPGRHVDRQTYLPPVSTDRPTASIQTVRSTTSIQTDRHTDLLPVARQTYHQYRQRPTNSIDRRTDRRTTGTDRQAGRAASVLWRKENLTPLPANTAPALTEETLSQQFHPTSHPQAAGGPPLEAASCPSRGPPFLWLPRAPPPPCGGKVKTRAKTPVMERSDPAQ